MANKEFIIAGEDGFDGDPYDTGNGESNVYDNGDSIEAPLEVDGKTFKSREDTEKHAKLLCGTLNGLSAANTKNRAYCINKVDHTVCSRATLTTVCRELYSLGYRNDNFAKVGWHTDPKLIDAKFYSKGGKQPILIRETSTQWGIVITLLGEYIPFFDDALDALSDVIGEDRLVTMMHPMEGTSGIALIVSLNKEIHAAVNASIRMQASARLSAAPGIMVPDAKKDKVGLDEVMKAKGFIKKSGVYISMPLGVLVSHMGNKLVIVDTPWA